METRWEKIKERGTTIVICIVAALVGLVLYVTAGKGADDTASMAELTTMVSSSTAETETPQETDTLVYVDIKGAVVSPGVYQLKPDARVLDAIAAAGNFTEEADSTQINLAMQVEDQQMLYIPKLGEEVPEERKQSMGTAEETAAEEPLININTADSAALQQLSGIGEKKAQEIITYREANGSFKRVEDLQQVTGIGEKTVERLKPFLTVS